MPYLDDLLIIANSREDCLHKLNRALEILRGLDWSINTEKSRMEPQQVFNWLGVHYNLVDYKVQNIV